MQPEVSVLLCGHVDSGKTTVTHLLTGKWTDTHSEELKKGITIRLGYADAVIYKDGKTYNIEKKGKPVRIISIVDAPGHETLMATMLSGSAIVDGAILVIAVNEKCPQPQTKEHLMALDILGIKNIIIIQNKIDLVDEAQAKQNYKEIKEFVKGSIAENSPIIPLSAQHKVNVEYLLEAIEHEIKTPKRDPKKEPIMLIARSFDINKPGTDIEKLQGAILGGSLKQGKLKVGEKIELKPGRKIEKLGKITWLPIKTEIVDIKTGGASVKELTPGGNAAVMTKLEPSFVKADGMSGNVAGLEGKLPPVWEKFKLKVHLLERSVGTKEELKIDPIKKLEPLMLNVNAITTVGAVSNVSKDVADLILKIPVCCEKKDRITVSRRYGARWHLIGWAEILS
jgi:translation initiation factor 2 subunit 3